MNATTEPNYRIDRETLKADAPLLALLVADLAYGLVVLPQLPARVPTHWDLSGQPNDWGPAWMNALLLPALGIAQYVLLLLLPLIDPKRASYGLFGDTLRFFRWAIALFLIVLHVVVVRISQGDSIAVGVVIQLCLALLFVALGNRFGTLRQNFFIGIRVPWTLSSEEVWNRTHRMAGRLWVAGGLVLVAAAFLPNTAGFVVFGVTTATLVAVPVFYSWRLYEKVGRSGA